MRARIITHPVMKWTLTLYLAFAALTLLWRFHYARVEAEHGGARWIWAWNEMKSDEPVAFFATRSFQLPDSRQFTRLRVSADPLYTLYFNGVEVGEGGRVIREGLDEWDVTDLAREGTNRIVIAVRSARGPGGLLATVGVNPVRWDVASTDDSWQIHSRWHDDLLIRESEGGRSARVLGSPPFGPWDISAVNRIDRRVGAHYIHHPREAERASSAVPVVRMLSGVPIAGTEPVTVTTFDFGNVVHGRIQLEIDEAEEQSLVRIRTAEKRAELTPDVPPTGFAVAPGETRLTLPGPRGFRYLSVIRTDVRASVVSRDPR